MTNTTTDMARPGTLDAYRFHLASLHKVAVDYGIDPDIAAAAADALRSQDIVLLGLNAKLAGGKDTVAPPVMGRLGIIDAEHVFFAKPIKAEFDEIITIIASSNDPAVATTMLVTTMNIPRHQAKRFVVAFFDVTRDPNHGRTGYTRFPEVRTALQYLGTEVRRGQDENYWVKRALIPAFAAMAEDRSVYFTDVRFPNEVLAAQRVGSCVVRLEVTRETQYARLRSRDGIEPDLDALHHASEVVLDDFTGFNAVIDNNGSLLNTVGAVATVLADHRNQVAS